MDERKADTLPPTKMTPDPLPNSQWLLEAPEALRRQRRERIATAALQGLLASPDGSDNSWDSDMPCIVRNALQVADALIAELDKP